MRNLCIAALLFAAVAAAAPAHAESAPAVAAPASLEQRVAGVLAAAPAGTRFGLLVVDDQGREVIAINPDQRFIPASNTKLFTTAAALEVMGTLPRGAALAQGVSVTLAEAGRGAPDLVIRGGGGVNLSTAPDCVEACLATLITSATGSVRRIRRVIADDTAFVDDRWSPGMSWNNIPSDSGTATSALMVDENALPIRVTAGQAGKPPQVALSPYFTLRNEAVTIANGKTRLGIDRAVNSRVLRLYGEIAVGAAPWSDLLGVDDPADYAAWAATQILAARGIKLLDGGRVVHRPAGVPVTALTRPADAKALAASYRPADPLLTWVGQINKRSQNLFAEALLRRLGMPDQSNLAITGEAKDAVPPPIAGSRDAGLTVLRGVLERAGIPRAGYDFSDGSGMSTYNRVSPRAGVALLRWAQSRPWGPAWRASFPVGGVDGTLRRRFAGTALHGRIWAKTGTLNATNALSGYLQTASGRELTFSVFANDVPDGGSAVAAMDAALVLIASAN